MNVLITHTTGSGDELEVATRTLRAEDLPPWVGATLEGAGAGGSILVHYPAEGRTVAYEVAE